MLNFFRRGGVGQVIVGAIVFAIIIVFVIEFRAGSNRGGSKLTRDCAVEVYRECIERKEFFAAFGLIAPRGLPAKQLRAMGVRKQILDGLAERELLVREAERLGISVSEEEIDAELATGRTHISMPASTPPYAMYTLGLGPDLTRLLPVKSQQTDRFDYKIYERVVRNTTNRSPREFKEMQRREIIAARMRDLIRSRVRISETEALREFEKERSKATARVVQLNRDWFAKYAVDLSPAVVEAWSKENQAQIDSAWEAEKARFTAGCPLVQEVMVTVDPGATDADKTLSRDRIEDARKRIGDGESFEQVARSSSDGPTSALGGELGCLSETGYGPGGKELVEAAKAMKPGEVSPVLETQRGFHVLKLLGTLDAAKVEAEGKAHVARKLASRFKADERARQFATDLIERVKAGQKLDESTRELSAQALIVNKAAKKPAAKKGEEAPQPALDDASRPKVEITPPFGPSGMPIAGARGENPAALAFALEKPDDVHGAPIATSDGFAVLQLKEKELAKREDFVKEKPQLLRRLKQTKEQEALIRYVAQLRKAASGKIKTAADLAEEPKQGNLEDE